MTTRAAKLLSCIQAYQSPQTSCPCYLGVLSRRWYMRCGIVNVHREWSVSQNGSCRTPSIVDSSYFARRFADFYPLDSHISNDNSITHCNVRLQCQWAGLSQLDPRNRLRVEMYTIHVLFRRLLSRYEPRISSIKVRWHHGSHCAWRFPFIQPRSF